MPTAGNSAVIAPASPSVRGSRSVAYVGIHEFMKMYKRYEQNPDSETSSTARFRNALPNSRSEI